MDGQGAQIRTCRFAGTFFPAGTKELQGQVDAFLSPARKVPWAAEPPCAVIAPHAGYRFSGAVAAVSYATVTRPPENIVVLSPSHRHRFDGIAFPSQAAFATPIGPVPIDRVACDALADWGLAHCEDAAHDNEHGIETQLPFLRRLWPDTPVVPLVIGAAKTGRIAQAVDLLARPGTLVVISSDLSHFLDQSAAAVKDAETAKLVETGAWKSLTPQHACGARALQGWMASRCGGGTKPLRLAMADSARASGDKTRVVGYGAWAFYPIDAAMLADPMRDSALKVARQALTSRLTKNLAPHIEAKSFAAPLQTHAASFVTLTEKGKLRGCIGSLAAHKPLVVDVAENAQKAALNDPRFPPVPLSLLPELRIKVAVLSCASKMEIRSEADALEQIVPGQDGLILSDKGKRGTFLPMVWDSLPDRTQFLNQLKRKAGLSEDHWSDDLTLHRFRAESFEESA